VVSDELIRFEEVLERASGKGEKALGAVLEGCRRLLDARGACVRVLGPDGATLEQVGGSCPDLEQDTGKDCSEAAVQTGDNGRVWARFCVRLDGARTAVFAFGWPRGKKPDGLTEGALRWLAKRVAVWWAQEKRDREARTDSVIMRMFSDLGRYYAGGHTFRDVLRAFGRVVREHLGLRHVCLGVVPTGDGQAEWLVRRGKLAQVARRRMASRS